MMKEKIWFSILLTVLILPLTAGVIIAENGTSRAEIVTGKNPPAAVRFAARELADFLGRAGNCSIQIRESSTAPVRIYLGATPETGKAGIRPKKNDHIISVRKDGTIYLAGVDDPGTKRASLRNLFFNVNDKDTLETVYFFLEKYAGVRWLEPGKRGEYVPVQKRLEIPYTEENLRPAFHERRCHYYQTATYRNKIPDLAEYGTADDVILWGMRLGYTSLNTPVYGCHSFAYLNFNRLLPEHPELFALQSDGHRSGKDFCWSNPAVEELWFKLADAWFRGDKTTAAAGYDTKWRTEMFRSRNEFMIDPHDYQEYFCCCDRCRELRRPYGKNGQGELIWKVIFNVARRIEKIHPGKQITTLVYPPKRFMPSDGNIPKNLRVRITVPWVAVLPDSPAGKTAMELIRKWAAVQQEKVYLWMYLCSHFNSNFPGVPEVAAHNMQKLFRAVKPSTQGIFYEHIEPSHTIRNLDQYAIAHLLRDPELDLDALLKDYFQLSFGNAAPEMESFFRRLESNWYKAAALHPGKKLSAGDHNSFLRTVYDTVYNYQELTTLDKLLDDAAGKVASKSPEALRIDRCRRYILGSAKQEFSVFSSDKIHRFQAEQLLCTRVIAGEPEAADWDSVPWLPLHTNDRAAAPMKHSRFKVLEDGQTFYVLAEFDEPQMDQAVSRDREQGDFKDLWLENLCELFFAGTSGKVMHLVVTDRGFHAVYDGSKRTFSQSVPGISIRTERGPAGWKMIAAIKHEAAGFSLKSNADRFNLTRTRALKGTRREFYTWSKSAAGRWSLPAGFTPVRRITGAVPRKQFSGLAQAPSDRPATVLVSAEKTKHSKEWRYWIQRGGKMTARLDSTVGHRMPGSRMIDYSREIPSVNEKTASWRYMIPLPERGSRIRVSVRVKAETFNPNAAALLSVSWNNAKRSWLKNADRLSGSASLPLKSAWQNIALEIPVPDDPAAAYMSVSISGRNVCPGKLWIDELQIEKIR